jgi:hypothetical protein
MFGTWFMPAGRRPERYGMDEPIPDGLVAQLRQPWQGLPRPRRLIANVIRHPIRTAVITGRAVRRGLGQVSASIHRPPASVHCGS